MKWVANYWLRGPYDYLDIYEAPNEEVATKVSAIIRTLGPPSPSAASSARACSGDRTLAARLAEGLRTAKGIKTIKIIGPRIRSEV